MSSPFPRSITSAGQGAIHLQQLPPSQPVFTTLTYSYPLKLLPSTPHLLSPITETAPAAPDPDCATPPLRPSSCPLLFQLTYGGGLLAGDSICVTLTLDPGTRLTIATQGMTKVFRPLDESPARASSQTLRAHIAPHAALWLAPDPVQPFAQSVYEQLQTFSVARGGNVGLIDWVVQGRKARNEQWDCEAWKSRNDIRLSKPGGTSPGEEGVAGRASGSSTRAPSGSTTEPGKPSPGERLLLRDAVVLSQPGLKERMRLLEPVASSTSEQAQLDEVGVFGTLLLRGPLFARLATFFVHEYSQIPRIGGRSWSPERESAEEDDGGDEDALRRRRRDEWRRQRLARFETYAAGDHGRTVLWTACHVRGCTVVKFMAKETDAARDWLGAMLREEGTVEEEFGPGGLMCVR